MKREGFFLINSAKRLGSMEGGEFFHLIKRRLWVKKARLLTSIRSKRSASFFFKEGNEKRIRSLLVLVHHDKKKHIPFYFDSNDKISIREIYKEGFKGFKHAILQKANEYCGKRFTFLGADFHFQNKINWHYDPISGREWPKKFIRDIVYTGPERIGDIKLPWELNRHQFLVVLGQAYYLSEDPKYAKEIVSLIRSWIRDNPPYVGINWISALEVGIRLISWVWAFHLIKGSDECTDEFIAEFLTSVEKQAEYVSVNLTIGRYANNHIIGEAASLAVVGMYFKELKKADMLTKKGLFILEREALKQINPDGGGVEQALGYLRFIVEVFLLAFLLARKNNIKIPGEVMTQLERAFEFMMLTLRPDGKAPNFGDSDDARAIFLSMGEYWDFRGLLALGAILFDRGDFKWAAGGPSEELLWLAGPKGVETYQHMEAKKPKSKSYFFKESGYAVMRDSWKSDANYLIFDCGSLGYKSGGHGHADALSIQMIAFGCNALIDPGTFAYNQDPKFRNYFRSTRAHNTITVDGRDQAEIADRMSWENIPATFVSDCYFSDQLDIISAENYGYRRLLSPVTHQRTLIFCKNPIYYLVIDKMIAASTHEYGLHFHFPPGTDLSNQDHIIATLSSNRNLFLKVKCSHALSSAIKEGDPMPMGWYSEAYGHKTESPAITFSCKADGKTYFYSLIVPYTDKEPVVSLFDGGTEGESTHLIVEYNSFKDIWLLKDYPGETVYGNVLFAGKSALIRQDSKGSLVEAYGINATRLQVGGESYLDSERPVNGFIVPP